MCQNAFNKHNKIEMYVLKHKSIWMELINFNSYYNKINYVLTIGGIRLLPSLIYAGINPVTALCWFRDLDDRLDIAYT